MRIFIDPGHGGVDPGATHDDLIEKDLVLEISRKVAARLSLLGHLVVMTRNTDFFINLEDRATKANNWLADVFVSIHLNADPDPDDPGMPEAEGLEFWIYPGSKEGRKLATHIEVAVRNTIEDCKLRGIKEGNFAVLRKTKMPAVLLELGFIDTEKSAQLKDAAIQDVLSAAVTAGIHNYSTKDLQGVV